MKTLARYFTRLLVRALAVATLAAAIASCHTLDIYRPDPRGPLAGALKQGAPGDPRPDLEGAPVAEGHPLYALEQFLRDRFPQPIPWTLRSSPLQDYQGGMLLGVTHYDAPGWRMGEVSPTGALVIEVRDDLDGWQQREVLAHEYAHVLAWHAPESAHGPVWAAYYGLIFKAVRGER